MSAEMLVEIGWKSAVAAGLTLLVLALLRRWSAAERSWVAHAGLMATLLLPAAALLGPDVKVEAPMLEATAPLVGYAKVEALPQRLPIPVPAPSRTDFATETRDLSHFNPVSWAYAVPAALLLGLLLVALARLERLRRRAEAVAEPRWLAALAGARRRVGYRREASLLVSGEIVSPISWGLLRPTIMVDRRAAGEAEAETIIAHELAHLARHDWAKLLLGRVAVALLWFNPLVWLLARQCRELCEEAVDDVVLLSDVGDADYAALLVGAARHQGRLLVANGVAPTRSELRRRVTRVLDRGRRRAPARRTWILASGLGAAALAAPLAALTPVRPAPADALLFLPAEGAEFTVAAAAAAPAEYAEAAEAGISPTPEAQPAATSSPGLEAALVEAIADGRRAEAHRLLAMGVSPNAIVPDDGTPLIAAARSGQREMTLDLLRRGAAIDQGADGDGNPLIAAAAAGDAAMVRLLLDSGADIDRVVPSDETALIQASGRGHAEIARLLIARGANVNARVGVRTALNMARRGGHREIEHMLVEAGARD